VTDSIRRNGCKLRRCYSTIPLCHSLHQYACSRKAFLRR